MSFFRNNPFVKILGFWLLGLLIAKSFVQLLFPLLAFVPVGLIWYLKLRGRKRYPFDLVASILIAVILVLLSATNYWLLHPRIPLVPEDQTSFVAVITERPTEKTNSYQTTLQILQIENDSLAGRKLAAVFEKSATAQKLQAGQTISARCHLLRIENAGNPFEFDYKSYMAQQGIYFRCYLSSKNYRVSNYRTGGPVIVAEQIREKLLTILRQKLKKTESLEVIPALTLGYRKDLQSETRNSFVQTGAMHVLAVSGLHVGLIFLFLSKAFFFLDRYSWGKWLKIIIITALLWAYALLTGFSPSVQRATLMFSFVLAGQSLRRSASIYNSIAASAFFLLLFNPDVLLSVGFQLSYAAVLSIVYFYPKLEQWWSIKNRLLKWFWQLFCVSLAAQIGTFPLTIFYFNQFPIYFWLSNFFVIPAAFVLLAGTFALFILNSIPSISSLLAALLDASTSTMLRALERISQLPGSVLTGISVSHTQLWCLIIIVILLILFIEYRRKMYFFAIGYLFFLFITLAFVNKWSLLNQQLLLEYPGKQNFYQLISGREQIILCTDSADVSKFVLNNSTTQLQLKQPQLIEMSNSTKIELPFMLLKKKLLLLGDSCYTIRQKSKRTLVLEHISPLLNTTDIQSKRSHSARDKLNNNIN